MIRNKRKTIKKINTEYNIHNRFDIEVIDSITGKIKQKAQAENVICDAIWSRILSSQTYFSYIHYGTGAGTPTSTDTSLFTFLGYGTPVYTDNLYSISAGLASFTRKIQLDETMVVGETLTEVGIAYGIVSTNLVTHAMLKDMNGNTISILKTATDIINIYATVFVHWDCTSSEILISASYKDNSNAPSGFLGLLLGNANVQGDQARPNRAAFTETGGFVYSDYNSCVFSASFIIDAVAKTMVITYPRLGASYGNSRQILGIIIGCHGSTTTANALELPAALLLVGGTQLPGTTITGETIATGDGITKDFKTAFSNLSSGTIYVDAVEQNSGVSIDLNQPFIASGTKNGIYPGIYNDGKFCHSVTGVLSNYTNVGNYLYYPRGGCVYNSFYNTCGIETVSADVYASNDLLTWIPISSGSVPESYKYYKYWRKQIEDATNAQCFIPTRTRSSDENIHFDTAPISGAVITADYFSKTIGKDSDHVYDLEVTITLNEYTA